MNIEGLAVVDDRLMVGLRAPGKERTHIVMVSVADLFAPRNAPSTAVPEVFPGELGAEALTVLEAQGDMLRVLIMFDGPPNSSPREYEVALK